MWLSTLLNSKGMDESSIPHTGRLYRLRSSCEAQSRFCRPGRTRTRNTDRTCVSSTRRRRLLAAAAASLPFVPVTPHVPLPSSTCVRLVLPSLSRLVRYALSYNLSAILISIFLPYIGKLKSAHFSLETSARAL
jgi:hypothetical protein